MLYCSSSTATAQHAGVVMMPVVKPDAASCVAKHTWWLALLPQLCPETDNSLCRMQVTQRPSLPLLLLLLLLLLAAHCRSDGMDVDQRKKMRALELVWRGSQAFGSEADLFVSQYPTGKYGA
jgi:hypothetical protein